MASSVFSVDKNPPSYEPYTFTLSDKFRKLAQEELREDDEIREQSLTQMREWIAKHPYIRTCRTDAVFLLRFLRFRKFSVPLAQEALERYLAMRQTFSEWFKQLDPRDELMQIPMDDEVFTIIGRDEVGRTVVFIRFGLFDVEKLNPIAVFRYTMLFLELLLDDEEVQIGGFRVWVDYTESLMKHYGMWGIGDLKLLMDAVNKTMPIRIREIQAAKLPKFAITLANLLLSFASSKFRERIVCNATVLESKKHFDESLWPKQYGGTHDTKELARDLKKQFEEKRTRIMALDDMDIDIEHYTSLWGQSSANPNSDIEGGVAGCFRKFNVD
ncbi:clavesin-1-like [Ochlerotatus camptorhynchus]|uniref:clavesin-1-like n=1 Tax=Ochlerotatus camptorhynchus TaxID=644619 RepID=UPI0031D12B77